VYEQALQLASSMTAVVNVVIPVYVDGKINTQRLIPHLEWVFRTELAETW
jgi:hypothetical protein